MSNASAAKSSFTFSQMGKLRFKLTSRLKIPGPRTLSRLDVPNLGMVVVEQSGLVVVLTTSQKAA